MYRPALLVAILTAGLPAVSAASALDAESASWTGGDVVASEVIALRYRQADPWQLTAGHLHVESVETPVHVSIPGVLWTDLEPERKRSDYLNVTVNTRSMAEDSFVYAMPVAGGATVLEASCTESVTAYSEDELQVPDQVQRPNPNPVMATNVALHGVTCGSTSWCGSFMLTMWSWTATGVHNGGEFTIQTGRDGDGTFDTAPTSAAQAYLTVTNGCLHLPKGTDVLANLFLVDGAVFHVYRATGTLEKLQAREEDLIIHGDFAAAMRRGSVNHRPTNLNFTGTIQSVEFDGRTFVLQIPASPDTPLPDAWQLALLLGAVMGTGIAVRLRSHPEDPDSAARFVGLARNHLMRHRAHRGRRAAKRALYWQPGNAEALSLRADAHLHLGQHRRALAHYLRAYDALVIEGSDEPIVGHALYHAACCASVLGRVEQALHLLQMAVRHEPTYAKQALDDPDFAKLSLNPAFQDLVNSPIGYRSVASP